MEEGFEGEVGSWDLRGGGGSAGEAVGGAAIGEDEDDLGGGGGRCVDGVDEGLEV